MSVVLIIEDSPSILRGLEYNLIQESYHVLTAPDGEKGYKLVLEGRPDLIILDLMLPKMSGFELCRKLRAEGFSSPILMLTARGEETDRVLGLDLGADDYVTKPYSILEVLAQVRALLRRVHPKEKLPEEVRFDDVVVDFVRCNATKSGAFFHMKRKEFGILRFLAARAGQIVTRDELLKKVWGLESDPITRTVGNQIALLRAKLEDNPSEPRRLMTVHGVGYKLIV